MSVESETPDTNDNDQTMTYTCGESSSNADEADVGCNYNGETNTAETSGNLTLNRWVDINFIAKW